MTASHQQTLDFVDDRTLEERFAEWMEGHGAAVYALFREIAGEIRDAGQVRYGGKAIAEIARYRRIVQGRDSEGWKVNNSFVSLMVRRLIDEDSSFDTFFERRQLKG